MRRCLTGMIALAVAACGRAKAPASAAAAATKSPEAAQSVGTMPDAPPGTSGMLRLVSSGPDDLSGSVPTRAGLCENPAVLLVQSTQQGFGALLVLALPAPSARVGRYPVTYSVNGPAKLPTPPAAQLAVQRVTPRGVFGFQALEGNVELYGFGERVSGRFQVTVREVSADRIDRLAGSFANIPVERQPASYCRGYAASADSTARGQGR